MATVDKNLGTVVARMVGDSPVMDTVAAQMAGKARAAWNAQGGTGHMASSIKVSREPGRSGVMDRIVYATDAGAGPAEFGHATNPGKDGSVTYVPGLHIFRKVARDA